MNVITNFDTGRLIPATINPRTTEAEIAETLSRNAKFGDELSTHPAT
jgi:hypothetical protein